MVHGQHHTHAADEQNGSTDADPLESRQKLIHIIGIAGEPGLCRGNGQLIHLPGGKALELPEQIVTDGSGDLAGADGTHPVGNDIARQTAKGAKKHQSAIDPDGFRLSRRDLLVQHDLHKAGDHQLRSGAQKLDQQCQDDKAPIRADVFFQLCQRGTSFGEFMTNIIADSKA